ncbi:lipopolysaccharide biosynthesis protein [Desulfosporosinus nitroreducens]|uniref:Oligosaccharide flippase family protein n=1 Tax=Desulfosporosinus nitroreducens TaxID=2018668 RepID=A0ABT8QSE5_9FIRM|nr:oligosaccharide flippase family protein [Desulfosporosinus nitroreducens]MDO0824278.1 oligosaccharide flippase family protein [Desulfosporosinus nitroreducens]
MSREGKLVKNTAILAIGTFFPKLAAFIILPILTACLTKDEYGTYDLILTLVSLILPAVTLQIQSAAFRFLIDVRHDEDEIKKIITNIYGFVIITSLIALCAMYYFLGNQRFEIRLAICSYFFFDLMSNSSRQVIRGLSKNIEYSISAFVSSFGQVVLTIVLVLGLKMGLLGGIIALCFSELLSTVFLFFKGRIYRYIDFRELNMEKIKELLDYSWPMVPNSLSQWVIYASNRLVITFFMGTAANAVFAVAYKIPAILSFAQTTFNMAWQEHASIISKDEDVATYFSSMYKKMFEIVAGCMAVLIGITPIIFKILVRGDYEEAYNQIPILYMGIFFFCLSSFWGGIFVAYRKTKIVGTTTVAAAICNLLIAISTIQWIGLYAASISLLTSYLLLCIIRMIGVQKIIRLNYNWRHITIVIGLLVVQCVICFQKNIILNILNFLFGFIIAVAINKDVIKIMINRGIALINRKMNG